MRWHFPPALCESHPPETDYSTCGGSLMIAYLTIPLLLVALLQLFALWGIKLTLENIDLKMKGPTREEREKTGAVKTPAKEE